MKLLIVSGSQRTPSQSAKVAGYLSRVATQFSETHHIELCRYHLPFWDGEQESKTDESSSWPLLSARIREADALILITPEWGGMATPILKNFLLMCDMQEVAHKPVLLVSVVNGISGAYPIAELRMNALKNNKLVAVPDHLIIRNVEEMLNDNKSPQSKLNLAATSFETEQTARRDSALKARINYSLHMLYQYSQALSAIRHQHLHKPYPKQQEYRYGM
ncbi:NADPH-dependent FMN reductase [Thalassomonas actiniarum]|uniref:NAD(P)H-dependent oxidoreductase n=1 Tax=Thalassomonas actiniarum TaxID=485447 RepID=A0AAE9YM61_9GAMM|nr:NAD(P)H-dependent oxidoreductase [Thalassomonas actiniarum]WDD97835.1 NAD(P)H-dependent oxidoreductase [Thalassomonas actiniarum]